VSEMPDPTLEFVFGLTVMIDRPQRIGETGRGNRQITPITGGAFTGPTLKGKVLPGGADWSVVRPDGTAELDVRITLETDDGALIYAHYPGYLTNVPQIMARWRSGDDIPLDEYYFAVTPTFDTSAEPLAWLTSTVFVGIGRVISRGVEYRVYALRR
jgi:hypothetical protein